MRPLQGCAERRAPKVTVEIIGPEGAQNLAGLDEAALENLGAEIGRETGAQADPKGPTAALDFSPLTRFENRAEAWIPLGNLVQIASSLPKGFFIR